MSTDLDQRIETAIDYEAARTAPPQGFPQLSEIPGRRYTSPEFYNLEMEHLWRKAWVCVGREDDLREIGRHRTFDKLGVPMVLVRGRDGVLRAFYNTCRHRGAPVVREASGRTTMLRCQYHSWSYSLDGTLVAVPDERDFPCLDKSTRGLMPIKCQTWNGWVFLSQDPDAPLLEDYLAPLADEFAPFNMNHLRPVHYKSYTIDCNWKAAMDAFCEVYHLKTIHPTNAAIMLDHEAAAMGLMPDGHSRMVTRKVMEKGLNFAEFSGAPNIDSVPDFYRRNNVAYNIFPNVVTPVDPVGFPFLLFWPKGVGQCEMEAIYVGPDWGEAARPEFWDTYTTIYDQVLEEDMKNLEPIQASLNSGAFSGMMLNYQERRIYWIHEEIDRRIGAARIPEGLAVKPVLAGYAERQHAIAAE